MTRLKYGIFSIYLIISCHAPSAFGKDNEDSQYRPMPFMGGGYEDKIYSSERWMTWGFTAFGAVRPYNAHPENAPNKAIYRMALLAKSFNFKFFQVNKVSYYVRTDGFNYINASAKLWGVGISGMDVPLHCEIKGRLRYMCANYDADKIIYEIGPQLGQTPEMADEELSFLRSSGR